MAINTHQKFQLDLTPGGAPPVVHASQGDIGRDFTVTIYNGGYSLPSDVDVVIRGKKPDKTVFEYDVTFDDDTSEVSFSTTEQMTIISGGVECELVFTSGGDIIASANFILMVKESPYDPNAMSESDVESITDVLTGFQRLNRDANGVVKIGDDVTASGTADSLTGFYVHDENTNADGVAKLDFQATSGLSDVAGVVSYTTAAGYFGTSGEVYSSGATTQEVYSVEYIPVRPGMKMVLNLKFPSSVSCWAAFVGYTKGMSVIGRTAVISSTSRDVTGVYTVPSNCYYVRVSYRTYGTVTATLRYGGVSEFLQNTMVLFDKSEELNGISYDENTLYYDIVNTPRNKLLVDWFEHGNLDGNGANQSYRDESRARTKNILAFPYPVVIFTTTGQYILFYFTNGSFSSSTGWKSSTDAPIYLPANQQFKLLVTKNNGAPATQYDELESIIDILNFYADPPAQVNLKNADSLIFEHGHFEASTNANGNYNGASRLRSNMIKLPYSLKVTMTTGSVVIACYDDQENFLFQTAWRENAPFVIPAGYKFRLLLSLTKNTNTPATTSAILAPLKLEPLDIANYSASPNIIYQCRNVDDTVFPPYSKYYIQAAAKNQYDRVRFNVRKTTDGYYFLCHDATINSVARNPDGTEISGTVSATGRTLAELNAYDWGIKYGTKYAGMGVPLLEDALKFSALYNLGVTIETYALSDTEIQDTLELCNKYGITDNLIVIDAVGTQIAKLKKFVDYNPHISAYVGAIESWYTGENVESVKTLQTPYNKVYVQLYPWGTTPSDEFIALAKENGFVLYNSIIMSKEALLNESVFNKGYGLIEANNCFAIKDTVQDWVNSLVDVGET